MILLEEGACINLLGKVRAPVKSKIFSGSTSSCLLLLVVLLQQHVVRECIGVHPRPPPPLVDGASAEGPFMSFPYGVRVY